MSTATGPLRPYAFKHVVVVVVRSASADSMLSETMTSVEGTFHDEESP